MQSYNFNALNSFGPDIKEFLEEKVEQYNNPDFIESDPVSVPHQYNLKEDIEISGFLTAIIAWGNRKSIIRNAARMMNIMGNSPYDFIINHTDKHLRNIDGFVHRTFNSTDLTTFFAALRRLYLKNHGLEGVFSRYRTSGSYNRLSII